MRRKFRFGCGLLFLAVLSLLRMPHADAGSPDGDYFLEVNKGIDVFGRVYKEITANYVDEIQPSRFMETGIDAMLASLDPYTTYIDREEGDEVELLTSGKYGGIGVTIGHREGLIQVISVMDGYSAQKQGILPGDRIIAVDDVEVGGRKPDEVRNLTRGTPGTEVKLLIEREGEENRLSFVLIREEIRLKDVTYASFVEDGIGYIRLERFSRKAGEEVRQALKQLREQGQLTSVVLDVRGNPGGLLDAAVEVVSKFVPKGSRIVSTKGRRQDSEKVYSSQEEPLAPDVRLVVLTDRESASASEIVSGALQDLDRAMIVGDRTFGKGLVQTILPLSYGAQLKVTTARYYIPSGRSIQEIDYKKRNADGLFSTFQDSIRAEFRTAGGRVVFEHGGITPDSIVVPIDEGPMVEELNRKAMFFRFMNTYAGKLKKDLPASVDEVMVAAFRSYLTEQGFEFQERTEEKIQEIQAAAKEFHYDQKVLDELARLSDLVDIEKKRAFDRYQDHIRYYLQVELSARLDGEQGRIEASLRQDIQLESAVGLLKGKTEYDRKIRG
jgi:carboxyl-terminal processing protease